MRLPLLVLAGVMVLPGPRPSAGPQNPASIPAFPSGVELVTVDAVVLDSKGHPVPGLTQEDFQVTEDGKPVEIARFEAFVAGSAPVTPVSPELASNESPAPSNSRAFAILLDDLRMTSLRALAAREAAASFLQRSLHDGDEVTVGTTTGEAWWSARLPEGREDLLAVLGRVKGQRAESNSLQRMTDYEAFWINSYEASPALARQQPDRPASAPTAAATPEPDPGGGSIKERVKKRWKELNLCTGTSCEGMVKDYAADLNGSRKSRTGVTLQAVRRGLNALAPVHGRKSLLFLSEGFIDDPDSDMRGVEAVSREANTALYFIDIRGLGTLPGGGSAADVENTTLPQARTAMGLEEVVLESGGSSALADATGGFSVHNTNDFAAGLDRIAEESRVFYLLGFYPREGKSAKEWRKLKVEVRRPGLQVRARRGYTLRASLPASKPGKTDVKKPTLDPAVIRALDSAHDERAIPLRVMTYVVEPRPKGSAHVVVAAEFDASRLTISAKGEGKTSRLELSVVTTHRDSGHEFRSDDLLAFNLGDREEPAWRATTREFDLPVGVAQARVVARDPTSGALGCVSQRFEVPPPGSLWLSTPILTDRLDPASKGQAHPHPALAVHRSFRPQGALYVQFEVFGASLAGASPQSARVSAGLTLMTQSGRVVRQAGLSPIAVNPDGRLVRLVGLGVDGLEEGPYELVLDVRDEVSGAALERSEAFTLAQEVTGH